MEISVSICTWNNCERLDQTLDSLAKVTVPPNCQWEVIVANNNCTDATDEVVSKYTDRLPIVYIKEPRQGLSLARNATVNIARGKLIIFTDDDVDFEKDYVASYWRTYQQKPNGYFFCGLVESRFINYKPDMDLVAVAVADIGGCDYGPVERPLSPTESIFGMNWACALAEIKKIGGFDVTRGLGASAKVNVGEETDLMRRLRQDGLTTWYIPEAKVYHIVPKRKCGQAHIGRRWEAIGFDEVVSSSAHEYQGKKIGKTPLWLLKKTLLAYGKWLTAKCRGQKAYKEYVEYQYLRGIIRGINSIKE